MAKGPGPTTGDALPTVTRLQRKRLLEDLLRGVSRSFYLTLRVLPGNLRQPVGLAYLLARAADTISDSKLVPPGQRRELLLVFRQQVEGPARLEPLQSIARALTGNQSLPAERALLNVLPEAFSLLEITPEPDVGLVRSVVVTLTRGMDEDLDKFPSENSGSVGSLNDGDELDRYAYLVAGCVGEFWTEISMAHLPALREWDRENMALAGAGFGKALQLTNVLRDVPGDLRMGRCYLPQSDLSGVGLSAEELLDPSLGDSARPLLVEWIKRTLEYYRTAEEYLLAIPRRCLRLRLAVLWPLLIGLATLGRLAENPRWLDPACPSRVSRRWVYQVLAMSWPTAYSDRLLRFWIGRLRRRVEEAL